MQLFGSLKLLMALLGSSCPLFGRSGPKMGPKIFPKNAQKAYPNLTIFFLFLFYRIFLDDDGDDDDASFGTQSGPALLHKIPKRFTRETKMSPRGPSWALKSLFKNLNKPWVFTRFWVQRPPKRASRNPRAAQETPKDLQNAVQKTDKKKSKNQCRGKKCLKPAISLLRNFGPNSRTQICIFF